MSRAVIDQPGSRIAIGGLLLALVLGLVLKNQIAPEKVQKQLQKAVSRLEKDFMIDFEDSHVNLSNWGLPWPRLEINRVRMSPKKNSCQSSQIFIDQIEVPISWTALIFNRAVVDTVRAHNVELRIADLENCLGEDRKVIAANQAAIKALTASSGKNINTANAADLPSESIFRQRTNSQLENIYIDQLKIVVKNQYQQPVILRQLHFKLDYGSQNLSQINVKSRILALNDAKTDAFYLVGDIDGYVKALDKQEFETHLNLKGRMLDGDIQLLTHFNSITKKISYEISTRKVSIKAFLPLAKLNGYEAVFEKWPLNLSFSLFGETDFMVNPSTSQIKVNDLQLAGEKTKLSADPLDVEIKKDHFDMKPFSVEIERLPLNSFKNLAGLKNDLNSFEDLGEIRGRAQFKAKNIWSLDGQLLNTYLIFSNRGTRELQKIDSVEFKSTHHDRKHEIVVSDFKMNNTEIEGELSAAYNDENESLTAKMSIEGALLNPKIWKQLTEVEQSPVVKMNWSYQKTADTRQQVMLSAPQISFQGMKFSNLQIDFIQAMAGPASQSLVLNMKAKEVLITVPELNNTTAMSLFNENSGLTANAYRSHAINLNMKGPDWKSMNFDFDLNLTNLTDEKQTATLKARGFWQDDKTLAAAAYLQNGARNIKYDISKTAADEVILTPVKTSQ